MEMDATVHHPKYIQMMESGVTDEDHVYRTFQVYLDLCEVRQWWNVQIHPCRQFNVIFISGHPMRGLDREFVVILGSSQSLSPLQTHQYIHQLQEMGHTRVEGITVAVIDTDSNTTFYKLTAGLVPPLPLVAENKFRNKEFNPGRVKRLFAYPKLHGQSDAQTDLKNTKSENDEISGPGETGT